MPNHQNDLCNGASICENVPSGSNQNHYNKEKREIRNKNKAKNFCKGPQHINSDNTSTDESRWPIHVYVERESFIIISGLIILIAMYIGTIIRYYISGEIKPEATKLMVVSEDLEEFDFKLLFHHIYRLVITTLMVAGVIYCVYGLMLILFKIIFIGEIFWPDFKSRLSTYSTYLYFLMTGLTQFIPNYPFSFTSTENYCYCTAFIVVALFTMEGFLTRTSIYKMLNAARNPGSVPNTLFS